MQQQVAPQQTAGVSALRRNQGPVSISADACNMIAGLYCNERVFEDAGDEIVQICKVLEDRVERKRQSGGKLTHELKGSDDQLIFLCQRYVKRYSKRMEILEKWGASEVSNGRVSVFAFIRDTLDKPFGTKPGVVIFLLVTFMVFFSAIIVVVQTVPSLSPKLFDYYADDWFAYRSFTTAFFVFEMFIRTVAAVLDDRNSVSKFRRLLEFYVAPLNVIDAASCLMTLPGLFLELEYNFFEIFRLLRLFRFVHYLRYFEPFEDLEETLKQSATALVGPFIAISVGLAGFASLVYTMEGGTWDSSLFQFTVRNADCEASAAAVLRKITCTRSESLFVSTIHSMWFVLITFLTVGYGDMVPLTMQGRLVGAATIIAGGLFTTMPIAIVGTNFTLAVEYLKNERRCVRKLLGEREFYSQDRRSAAKEALKRPAPLPSLSFCRYMRLALTTDVLDLSVITKRMSYYADLYLESVANELIRHEYADVLKKLQARAKMDRRPYAAKLGLLRFAAAHNRALIHDPQFTTALPLDQHFSFGTSPLCDVQLLYSDAVRHKIIESLAKSAASERTLSSRLTKRRTSLPAIGGSPGGSKPRVGSAEQILSYFGEVASGAGESRLIGLHHFSLSLARYGGTKDRLYLIPVAPFSTFLSAGPQVKTATGAGSLELSHRNRSTIFFDPAAAGIGVPSHAPSSDEHLSSSMAPDPSSAPISVDIWRGFQFNPVSKLTAASTSPVASVGPLGSPSFMRTASSATMSPQL
jgi:voltage-gated potassium channel Kch